MKLDALQTAFKHGISNVSLESCGFFYINPTTLDFKYHPLENDQTQDPDFFISKNSFFYNQYLKGNIISLYHTHLCDDPTPSEIDLHVSESLLLPSFIFSTSSKLTYLHYPEKYIPNPIEKRIFIPYFQDCLIYFKDFYFHKLGINLQRKNLNWSRRQTQGNQSLIDYLDKYFFKVNINEKKNGDLFLFRPTICEFMHLGVFYENMLYHHPEYSFSCKELITDEALNKVYNIYRYKDNEDY